MCYCSLLSLISHSFFSSFISADALNLSQWLPDCTIICQNWAIMYHVNLILSQNQINPYDRMHMSSYACVPACVCANWACADTMFAKTLNPRSVCWINQSISEWEGGKSQSLQTLPMDATSHEKAKHMDRQYQQVGQHRHRTFISNQGWRKMKPSMWLDLIARTATDMPLNTSRKQPYIQLLSIHYHSCLYICKNRYIYIKL